MRSESHQHDGPAPGAWLADEGPAAGDWALDHPAADSESERGGDPVCWLHLACPRCGTMAEAGPAATCPACGAAIAAD